MSDALRDTHTTESELSSNRRRPAEIVLCAAAAVSIYISIGSIIGILFGVSFGTLALIWIVRSKPPRSRLTWAALCLSVLAVIVGVLSAVMLATAEPVPRGIVCTPADEPCPMPIDEWLKTR
ncbi:hypothetical protein GCM10011410_12260 [Hoyosella rhizosphaerae]|uniref:Uncharacterized protein n=1 Tax=Hoyosella rhizosphaerae TaxID=1755582 RepID=A0A916U6U7_9ACTN|nr:hypothetical protein GCM10011410_12260 [Hoyosella rhizosphaerae]